MPESWIANAAAVFHLAYHHTSHGSQIIAGMNALENFPSVGDTCAWLDDGAENENLPGTWVLT